MWMPLRLMRLHRGLAEALSETFEEMHKDGTLKQILGKYLAEPERFMEVDGYEK